MSSQGCSALDSWNMPNLSAFFYNPISQPALQYIYIPINIHAVNTFLPDINQVMLRLDRQENLLQEIYEMVKVIEVETRRLNPDTIYELLDSAESGLRQVLNAVKEKRFPVPAGPEIEAMLTQAIERKTNLAHPAEGSLKR